jgi:probable nitrogen fixation protein
VTTTTGTNAFLPALLAQIRAADTYGRLDSAEDSRLLAPFIVTSAQKAEISLEGPVPPATLGRIRVYYQALAAAIEKATGVMTFAVVDLNDEGFGRALVLAGRLVVVSDTVRDAQRYGFVTRDKLGARGDRSLASALTIIDTHPGAAHDDG